MLLLVLMLMFWLRVASGPTRNVSSGARNRPGTPHGGAVGGNGGQWGVVGGSGGVGGAVDNPIQVDKIIFKEETDLRPTPS